MPMADVDPDEVPYFSLVLVPSPTGARPPAPPRPGVGEACVGEVVVVGIGPAGPRWLTPEAAQALRDADHLVGYAPYVQRVPHRPGQQRHTSGNQVELDRARHALDLAHGGAAVAVVSSGDPGVFAMASAVFEVADGDERYAAVPVRVLPGITAAQAAASRVGAPLGHDFAVLSLSDRLKPWSVIERRLAAAAGADLVLALYNPSSASRRWQVTAARDLLLRHRDPDTAVVVARDVGRPAETITTTTLGALDPDTVDMRCLLIVGSSRTRTVKRADGTTAVWTPRDYPS
jgi:precorrin-2 C20-methyltransferase/precorrin-3B C17-methyltransferase